jgi:hypothetical protein
MPTNLATVAGDGSCCKGDNSEQDAWRDWAPNSEYLRARSQAQFARLLRLVDDAGSKGGGYEGFEREVVGEIFRLGRLLITLFLCLRQERLPFRGTEAFGKETYRRQPPKPRLLGTFFGKVRYWRTYLEQTNGRPGGFFPVDTELGLTTDGFSVGTLSRAVQLATRMSFAAAAVVCSRFLGWSPSHKTIEQATLGLGRYTAEWVEHRPAPSGDGEVLVIQFDSKATPTVRDQELERRCGKRRPNPYPDSPRHRGRRRRQERGSKPRRKKGDKSKNGKMATVIVMYTLRRGFGPDGELILKGPINRWHYASYAPKRHAFAIARREADKRGFEAGSCKRVQIMTDGDEDLERYTAEFFPEARHSLDVIHVVEYLWKAGACLYRENSDALRGWVERQKDRLYAGNVTSIVRSIHASKRHARSERKRERLEQIANYLTKRVDMMDYADLEREDLELSSGMVEGAVRYIVAQRFDEGGMRWIKERAEALLQLRCIEINGEWDAFVEFVSRKTSQKQRQSRRQIRLLQNAPEPLPTLGIDE